MFKQHLLTLLAIFALAQFSYAQCVGGKVLGTAGQSTVYTCPDDGNSDIVNFVVEGASADTDYQFVITNSDFEIVGIPPGNMADVAGAGPGTCYVWGFAYTGDLILTTGMNIFQAQVATGCWNLSKTALKVVRSAPDAGTVALNDGRTEKTICAADGFDNVAVYTNTSTSDAAFRYVVTDGDNNILAVLGGSSQNFEGVPPGVCRVWGLSYTGNLTASAGDNAATTALSDDCFDLSENYIAVTRSDVDGGTVATADGETSITITSGDGISDAVSFMHESSSTAEFAYIVTDENNKIIGTPPGNTIDFEGAGPGICRVWGVSYTGNLKFLLNGTVGNFALSTDCFEVSENFVEVVRTAEASISGGTVAMPSGATEKYTCSSDDIADVITVVSEGATADANFTLVVTDTDGNILGVPPADMVDVTGAGPGICLVWGLAYTGDLTAMVGDNATEVALSSGEYALSSNFITLNRDEADGGTVAMPSGATERSIIAGDGEADVVEFVHEGASNSNYTYVVTDEDGNILGLPPGNSLDFEGAGSGVCLVWGLAYTGDVTAMVGDNALEVALSSECFDLSDNFITVTRTESISGGTIAMPNGATEKYTCSNDDVADVIMTVSSGATSNANFTLVVTDPDGNILGVPPADMVDVTGAGPGICLVWGLAYTGDLLVEVGENALASVLSDGEFALSSNYITLNRDEANGGTVAMPSGATERSIIAGDGEADVVEFVHEGASNSNYTYVVTDEDGNILGLPPGNSLDFEGAGSGVCLVWGLAYTGDVTAMVGDNALEVALSSECFDLSDNFITVTRTESISGGTIAMPNGATEKYTCSNDDVADVIMTVSSGATSNANFTLVVTDTDGNILGVPPADMVDVTGAGPGICLVWGLAYTGDLTAMVGDNANDVALSDGEYALSSNYITLNRDEANGGTVSTPDGATTVNTTAGDGEADVVEFAHEGASNSNYTYVITDEDANILGLPPGKSLDFEGAGEGVCLVWGLAYTGEITAEVGDNAAEVALSSECFDLSDNFITVNRSSALPSNNSSLLVNTNHNANVNLFPNPVAERLQLSVTNELDTDVSTQFIIFDALGKVVMQQQGVLTAGQNTYQFNVSDLADGLYILSIRNKDFQQSSTFVKK